MSLKPMEQLSKSQQYRRKKNEITRDGRGRHGHTVRGESHHRWNHGKIISSHGYVKIRVGKDHHLSDSNGYAYEHDIIAEKMLGRALERNEVVHHKNEDTQDNRPENLEVLKSSEHTRRHHLGKPNSGWKKLYRDSSTGQFISTAKPGTNPTLDGKVWNEFPE